MQILPAGIAMFIAQLCFGLVMAGIHYSAPGDKCTRYWAIGMVVSGAGVLLMTENYGALNHVKLMFGNCGVILGTLYSWAGLRAFYGRRIGHFGWLFGSAFVLAFGTALVFGATLSQRALLMSVALFTVVGSWLLEIVRGHRGRHTFASRLAIIGLLPVLSVYLMRITLLLAGVPLNLAQMHTVAYVVLLYFIPLASALLFASSLMLLYFERVIAENRRMANEDGLTGLLNRRAIATAGTQAVHYALRNRVPLTVAILDIDFFKHVNDRFGHDAGDQVLVDFAALLRTQCRAQDSVGRYGGEEFCMLFPGMDEAASASVAVRVLDTVRAYRVDQREPMTVSIGMAVLLPQEGVPADWSTLIKAADQQLYLAKQSGRDQCRCTVFATELHAPARRALDGAASA